MYIAKCKKFLDYIESQIARCKVDNDAWLEDFARYPWHALKWSRKAFESSTKLYVLYEIRRCVEYDNNLTSDNLAAYLQEQVNLLA